MKEYEVDVVLQITVRMKVEAESEPLARNDATANALSAVRLHDGEEIDTTVLDTYIN